MTQEDIHELLTRLSLFPKPYPRTMEAVVKVIERQRWKAIQGENEGCATAAEAHRLPPSGGVDTRTLHTNGTCSRIAVAIRARVKP